MKWDRIAMAAVGLVAGGAVTGAALVVGMVVTSLIFGIANSANGAGPNYSLMLISMTVMGGTVGLVPALVVGLPLHLFILKRRGWTAARYYAAVGAFVAIATIATLILVITSLYYGGQNMWWNVGLLILLGITTVAGAAGGLTFWIIRRPDRDKPAIPLEVFS